ncbi:hypothetical protein EPA93_07175 [Ktedonosporobacter rubrisoli]|uniref:Tetratricopeptide repeat protein n=1 Tax=Ktedonosporobacter rubrisoli TaxID=2509675 RepID=A0A4P6JKU7_KTERU|nr:hypothetical protein [Ktedonosporobacter rubrisoli]QBD75799.1 hypothetical protein EPA93_07175 [Ktedonosporobacter rubrisoli]
MEQINNVPGRNKIPRNIDRRRALAKILSIPPALLGLASLNEITGTEQVSAAHTLKYTSLDIERHDHELRYLWKIHYMHTAQSSFEDIQFYIKELESVEAQAKGNLLHHIGERLNGLYRLAATIRRDQGDFPEAYKYANQGVRVARLMGNDIFSSQVLSASYFTRGVVSLAWGAFGQKEKIDAAINDFNKALPQASPQLKGILWAEQARAQSLKDTTPIGECIALRTLEKAERYVEVENRPNDFYYQILVNGDMKGLDTKRFMIGRAKTFLSLGQYEKVRDELDALEELRGAPHARRRVWIDILYGQASLGMKDYYTTTQRMLTAVNENLKVRSSVHQARIQEIYQQLVSSRFNKDPEVKRLGKILKI